MHIQSETIHYGIVHLTCGIILPPFRVWYFHHASTLQGDVGF